MACTRAFAWPGCPSDRTDCGWELPHAAAAAHPLAARAAAPLTPCFRGWQAASGAGSDGQSQLLRLAPTVLQDMAITCAEAVAAGYLGDVEVGLDAARALRGASNSSRGVGGGGGGGAGDGLAAAGAAAAAGGSPPPAELVLSLATAAAAGGPAATWTGATGSVDGGSSGGGSLSPLEASWWPVFLNPQLSSTRQLQRFMNQVRRVGGVAT